jgi:Glycoside hydrolase 97.
MPLTLEAANGIKLCITEADLHDYPGMYLGNQEGGRSLRGVFASCPSTEVQGGHNNLQGLVRSRRNFWRGSMLPIPSRGVSSPSRRRTGNSLKAT